MVNFNGQTFELYRRNQKIKPATNLLFNFFSGTQSSKFSYCFSSSAFDCDVFRYKSTVKEQNWSSNPTGLFNQETKT